MSIAEKFETIADAVYEKGLADGAGNGSDEYYNTFWEVYQDRGTKTSYSYAFYSARWKDTNYKPKYDIIPSNANSMFLQSAVTDTVKAIDISKLSSNTSGMFQYSKLVTIHKLIVSEQNSYANGFTSCSALQNITFEGVIGKDISFADCPLTIESMKNIIEHLKDYTDTDDTNDYKYTVTFKTSAFNELEKEGATAEYKGAACTWAELIDNKKWNLVKA